MLEGYSTTQIVGTTLGALLIYNVAKRFNKVYFSPLYNLPTPPESVGYFWGDFLKLMQTDGDVYFTEWFPKLGSTLRVRGLFWSPVLATKDAKAMTHILHHAYDFPKPKEMREALGQIFGEGILLVEGEAHKRQRKVMSPCFNNNQLRAALPIFYEVAERMVAILESEMATKGPEDNFDMLMWFNRAGLDIIGFAGFDYDFNSLVDGDNNELAKAIHDAVYPDDPNLYSPLIIFQVLLSQIPGLKRIPNKRSRAMKHCLHTLRRVGGSIVAEKKAAILASQSGLKKGAFESRDLIGLLVKANMATDLKEHERLTDLEVVDQVSTMLLAGHETSSSTLAFLFYELAKPENHRVQDKLREEILAVTSLQPTMEELNALPYLDAVIKENLRLNGVVPITTRSAGLDTVIPLGEPFRDRNGVLQHEIRIAKGEQISIPIASFNRDKKIWGEDADEFKPERWLDPSTHPKPADTPGVFAALMTFIGGTRSCIGWRFAVLEIKAVTFVMLKQVKVDLPVTPLKIGRSSFIVVKPSIKNAAGKDESTMPLRLSPVLKD